MPFSRLILSWLLISSSSVYAATTKPFAHLAQGLWQGEITVTIKKGDTLTAIGGRYATTPQQIATANALDANKRLKIGQVLKVKYAHLIPKDLPEGIVINLPQRLLFFKSATKNAVYAVALGRSSWPTPVGDWTIANKQENKTWFVPKSIQEEMANEGKTVITRIPPGENNPLGKYWLGLSMSGYGIHGTIAPSSIYRFQTHGCIRLYADDIAELFTNTTKGLTGSNKYWPILLEIRPDSRIVIEVNPNIYKQKFNSRQELQQLADSQQVSARINWTLADNALKLAAGVPVDITLTTP